MARSVGVVGLGSMGFPMAKHFLADDHDVCVYDIREDPVAELEARGAAGTESPAEVAEESEVVFLVVQNESQVEEAVFSEGGIADGLSGDETLVISSSVLPEFCVEVRERLGDVDVLDAPMCRGADAAREGNLLILVGGDRDVYEATEAVFHALGSPEDVFYMGELGLGQVAKSANNALLWAGLVADIEVFELCREYGMDVDHLTDALRKSSGVNWGVKTWTERYPRHIPWAHKDMDVVLKMARENDMSMPLSGLVSQLVFDLREEWKEYDE